MIASLLTQKLAGLAFPDSVWDVPVKGNEVFLTFDDGPDPQVTPHILDCLNQFGAKATFFCLGKNVEKNPLIFNRIKDEGHGIGNHTYSHKNGWKTPFHDYIADVDRCSELVPSSLFRPPYGRITPRQARQMQKRGFTLVMWSVLSKDYNTAYSPEEVVHRTLKRLRPGAIAVFHDSLKAAPNVIPVLPVFLKAIREKNLVCIPLPGSISSR